VSTFWGQARASQLLVVGHHAFDKPNPSMSAVNSAGHECSRYRCQSSVYAIDCLIEGHLNARSPIPAGGGDGFSVRTGGRHTTIFICAGGALHSWERRCNVVCLDDRFDPLSQSFLGR
jgi:hypothetical protein